MAHFAILQKSCVLSHFLHLYRRTKFKTINRDVVFSPLKVCVEGLIYRNQKILISPMVPSQKRRSEAVRLINLIKFIQPFPTHVNPKDQFFSAKLLSGWSRYTRGTDYQRENEPYQVPLPWQMKCARYSHR